MKEADEIKRRYWQLNLISVESDDSKMIFLCRGARDSCSRYTIEKLICPCGKVKVVM